MIWYVYFSLSGSLNEQLTHPLASCHPQITPHLDTYPNADLLWCQEEPLNNGAWTYVAPRIQTAANQTAHHVGKTARYAGRDPSSSVATGSKLAHKKEIQRFLDEAFAE